LTRQDEAERAVNPGPQACRSALIVYGVFFLPFGKLVAEAAPGSLATTFGGPRESMVGCAVGSVAKAEPTLKDSCGAAKLKMKSITTAQKIGAVKEFLERPNIDPAWLARRSRMSPARRTPSVGGRFRSSDLKTRSRREASASPTTQS